MNFDKVIGIDTGISGGFAIKWRTNVGTCKMPTIEITKGKKNRNELDVKGLQKLFIEQREGYTPIVFIEKVQGWISDAEDNPGKRFHIQKMVSNYEALKSIITLCDLPFIEVTPQSWQSYLNLGVKGAEKSVRKNLYKKAAQSWYPELKISAWNADAVCIMRYGLMKIQLDKDWVFERLQNYTDPRSQLF